MDAFRHFVDRYQGRALAHARVLTRIAADAADATQEDRPRVNRQLHPVILLNLGSAAAALRGPARLADLR